MDSSRCKGAPLKAGSSLQKETLLASAAMCVKSLLRSRRELCAFHLELQHIRGTHSLTEVHFVCLPPHTEGETCTTPAQPCSSPELADLLRTFQVCSLRNEEILLLKDSKKLIDSKDNLSQARPLSKAVCVFRHGHPSPMTITSLLELLSRYTAGIKYALELQSLPKGASVLAQLEEDDTSHSVSSIEEDFVTAFEHLDEEESEETHASDLYRAQIHHDVASQTSSNFCQGKSLSFGVIDNSSKSTLRKQAQQLQNRSSSFKLIPTNTHDLESECAHGVMVTSNMAQVHQDVPGSLTESDDSDCSCPSPIIFLDEVDYKKSLDAKLNIPKIPTLKDGVEDSDSEVSDFFDSFDQFEDLDATLHLGINVPKSQATAEMFQTKNQATKDCSAFVPKYSSTMNPRKFDHSILPANIKKPTPLKPGSPFGGHSDMPDSPQPVKISPEDTRALFSPVSSSAFSPLADGAALKHFWKLDGKSSELNKLSGLCSTCKTYSDFANNFCGEILGSVCGHMPLIDANMNTNLSCVCHKKFRSISGHFVKLSDIQETLNMTKSRQYGFLKDGIQRFAVDLVEMSVGSALRDIQRGMSACTTTLCHLAARLTSSVFHMAFQEIGLHHAYVLKERAINGLANFLVGEALSGALREILSVKSQMLNKAVAKFASDLAEELVFECIMEVSQFSHSFPCFTTKGHSYEKKQEVFSSYAVDLSESVLQEAFIELSRVDTTFTTKAAFSVSSDNISEVSSENKSKPLPYEECINSQAEVTTQASDQVLSAGSVEKIPLSLSEMAISVPVPMTGQNTPHLQDKRMENISVNLDRKTDTLVDGGNAEKGCSAIFYETMVDKIVSETFGQMVPSKVKKKKDDSPDLRSKPATSKTLLSPGGAQCLHSTPKCSSAAPQSSSCDPSPLYSRVLGRQERGTHPSGGVRNCSIEAPPTGSRKGSREEELLSSECGVNSKSRKYSEHCQERKNKQYLKIFKNPQMSPSSLPSCSNQQDSNVSSVEDSGMVDGASPEHCLKRDLDCTVAREHQSGAATKVEVESESSKYRLMEDRNLHFVGDLGHHIVSMATDTGSMGEDMFLDSCNSEDSVLHSAKNQEHGLNGLQTFAGNVTRDLMSDVRKCIEKKDCPHNVIPLNSSRSPRTQHPDNKVAPLNQGASDCLSPDVSANSSSCSVTSCESANQERWSHKSAGQPAGRREGGGRELGLDQFASQLARRSLRAGLAHAANKLKQKSPRSSFSFGHFPISRGQTAAERSVHVGRAAPPTGPVGEEARGEYVDLLQFAESLAHRITCDVTRKMKVPSAHLPKSLTDSCLYQKTLPEGTAESPANAAMFPSSFLPNMAKNKLYHSTGSLRDGSYSGDFMQVIEHYAQRIIENTLEMALGNVAQMATRGRPLEKRSSHDTTSDGESSGSSACGGHHCSPTGDGANCGKPARHLSESLQRERVYLHATGGLDVPKIQIQLDKSVVLDEKVLSKAVSKAKRELSNTSLNADSGISQEGASFAESLTTEIVRSAIANVCQTINLSICGREGSGGAEAGLSRQFSLSAGEDSLGSWSNLSFEDDHPDESSSFFHLSDSSNGNSSSWSSLGLEGEAFEEHVSLSPLDSEFEEKEEVQRDERNGACVRGEQVLVLESTEVWGGTLDPQLRSLLHWVAASAAHLPLLQQHTHASTQLHQLPAVLQKVRERQWRIGDLLQALLRFYEHSHEPLATPPATPPASAARNSKTLFQWLLEQA